MTLRKGFQSTLGPYQASLLQRAWHPRSKVCQLHSGLQFFFAWTPPFFLTGHVFGFSWSAKTFCTESLMLWEPPRRVLVTRSEISIHSGIPPFPSSPKMTSSFWISYTSRLALNPKLEIKEKYTVLSSAEILGQIFPRTPSPNTLNGLDLCFPSWALSFSAASKFAFTVLKLTSFLMSNLGSYSVER